MTNVYHTGDRVTLESTFLLPNPLAPLVSYYAIYIEDGKIKLADTFLDAVTNNAIPFAGGAGTHYIKRTGSVRRSSGVKYLG